MAAKRISSYDARNDIENAFRAWINAWYQSIGPDGATEDDLANEKAILAAQGRVIAFLENVIADRELLCDALEVCQAMAAAEDDLEIIRAKRMAKDVVKLAREAIEG